MFQANAIEPSCIRPAIYHSFGKAKNYAKGALSYLCKQGWESLAAALTGVENRSASWHRAGWKPFAGVQWHGKYQSYALCADTRDVLLACWVLQSLPASHFLASTSYEPGLLLWEEVSFLPDDPANPVPVVSPIEGISAMSPVGVSQGLLSRCHTVVGNEVFNDFQNPLVSCQQVLGTVLRQLAPESSDVPIVLDPIVVDCPGLGGTGLGLQNPPDMTVAMPRVGHGHLVYGPTLAPADLQRNEQVIETGVGLSVALHNFGQFMLDANRRSAHLWEDVTGVPAGLTLHRTCLVLQHATRIAAHRLPPHPQFNTAVCYKLLQLHPSAAHLWLSWLGLKDLPPTVSVPLVIRGFSAGSYTGAALAVTSTLDFSVMFVWAA